MSVSSTWSLPGDEGEPIIGNTHLPQGEARGVVLVGHGFKGYKDYGMFPRLAASCAAAGFVAHRFNFSHSGMTDRIDTFERPDLFRRDTWSRQVRDERRLVDAVASGRLAGQGLPYVMFGHSRGGVTALLTAGRHADDSDFPAPAGIITAAAPHRCLYLSDEEQATLEARGELPSPSSRTGQDLAVGLDFLREQLDDPAAHDLLALAARIRCPVLVVHGTDDPTVPAASATAIADAVGAGATKLLIEGANHVFNTPNPLPDDAEASPELARLIEATIEALRLWTAA